MQVKENKGRSWVPLIFMRRNEKKDFFFFFFWWMHRLERLDVEEGAGLVLNVDYYGD